METLDRRYMQVIAIQFVTRLVAFNGTNSGEVWNLSVAFVSKFVANITCRNFI